MTWPTWWQWILMGAVAGVPIGLVIAETQIRRDKERDRRARIDSWNSHHG